MKSKIAENDWGNIYARNKHGILIRCCCASCDHCQSDGYDMRLCLRGKGHKAPRHWCPLYQMRENLNRAGFGNGSVKHPLYLRMLNEQIQKNLKLVEKGKRDTHFISEKELELLRKRFMRNHKSLYIF